jgi:hypothetical protein
VFAKLETTMLVDIIAGHNPDRIRSFQARRSFQ